MTETDISKVLIEGDYATIMGVKYKRVEEPKSVVEEAYKDWWGEYPSNTWQCDVARWEAFKMGYNAAYEEKVSKWEPTPQTPEQVADGLKEAFREAVKQGIIHEVDKVNDVFMNEMVEKLKGQTLRDVCMDWWDRVFGDTDDTETCIDNLVDEISLWLPKYQSAAGSQNAYVESAVEGFNDCLDKIKRKLR